MNSKVFLDTCIWMELCVLSNPVDDKQVTQNAKATQLLAELLSKDAYIITIRSQIAELFQVILKTKMKECNNYLKENNVKNRVSSIKEFRQDSRCSSFLQDVQVVCQQVLEDMKRLSKDIMDYEINVESIIQNIISVDVNDSIYHDFCKSNNIKLYTFDKDFKSLEYDQVSIL